MVGKNPKSCVACGTQVLTGGIHQSCLKRVYKLNEELLFEHLPAIIKNTAPNNYQSLIKYAQGLAIECNKCFRVTIPRFVWNILPINYQLVIGNYIPGKLPIKTCIGCQEFTINKY